MARWMRFVTHAHIGRQVLLTFGLLLTVICVNSALFITSVISVADSSAAITRDVIPINNALHDLRVQMTGVQTEQLLYDLGRLTGSNPSKTYNTYYAPVQAAQAQMARDYAIIAAHDAGYPDFVKTMATPQCSPVSSGSPT
jgi:CHASE3 domain sensor protein